MASENILGIVYFNSNCSCNESVTISSSMVVYRWITFMLSVINVFANLFSLYILSHPLWKEITMSHLLRGISIYEAIFNFFMFLQILSQHFDFLPPFLKYGTGVMGAIELWLMMVDVFVVTFQMCRNWSLVFLSFYRYQMVCRATSDTGRQLTSNLFTSKNITRIDIIIFVICLTISWPRILEELPEICIHTGAICLYKQTYTNNPWFQYCYIGVILFLFQSWGPVTLVIVFSCLVIRKINLQSLIRQKSFGHSLSNNIRSKEKLATRNAANSKRRSSRPNLRQNSCSLVLLLSICFAILEIPGFFSKVLWVFNIHNSYLSILANILITFDSTLNLVIYLVSNSTFRYICKCTVFGKKIVIDNGRGTSNKRISKF